MIAALFVRTGGVYFGVPGVDPWDVKRDARGYDGPWPVVAHPPCERWGRYWHGSPKHSDPDRFKKGDDGGCFAHALATVRRFGGVLEHPEFSSAWSAHGLNRPPHAGGWVVADWLGGWTCRVEQGHYGHRARKGTWLYACRVPELPSLKWGSSALVKPPPGRNLLATRPPRGMTPEQRAARRAWLKAYAEETGKVFCCAEQMSKRERASTPLPFRDLLLALVGSVRTSRRGRRSAA